MPHGFDNAFQPIKPQKVPFLHDIMRISSGGQSNLCLDKNGKVWVFGRNEGSELGLGHKYRGVKVSRVVTATMNPYLDNIEFIYFWNEWRQSMW